MTEDDEFILKEARERFARAQDYEAHFRTLYMEDFRFGHGDSDNMAQWPDQLLVSRELDQKPTLTINKTRVHCLQIVNDAKQNKPGIVVHPTTNEATYDAAEAYEDVVRHIEYVSRAQQAYDQATYKMVFGGIGYCRVVTRYTDPVATLNGHTFSNDQDVAIQGIADPMTVYMDPDAKEADKSDMEWCFVFDDMSKDRFKREYPGHEDAMTPAPTGMWDSWLGDDHIRVAEYWRRKHERVQLVSIIDPATGERRTARRADIDPDLLKVIRKEPSWDYRERDADVVTVECHKIAGNKVIDHFEWAGRWIPIVPCIGEEVVVDGEMDRKSHVRYLKDPQRMYNYNSSAAVELGALQTKTPYVGSAKAFEGYEEYWQASNVQNLPFLPFNDWDDDGNRKIDPPKREPPPQMSAVFIKGMDVAEKEMMMASGQYQSQFGENENATSGKAINERQRQGDNATYHFIDGAAIMVRQIGRIVVDLIPKVYDTTRVMQIRGEDGVMKNIVIAPDAQQAVQRREDKARQQVELIFNPNIGQYGVEVDVGPSFATRRQEAWNAIIQILTQSPQLIPIVGDLLFQNADFPGADEIALRLRRMAPPAALGDGPNPEQEQMQMQIEKLNGAIGDLNALLRDKSAEINIRAFEANTKRLTAIGNAGPIVTQEQAQPLIVQTEREMLSQPMPQQAMPQRQQPGVPPMSPGMVQG